MKVLVTIDVPDQRLKDMLTNAFEGGSNYWYAINTDKTIYPPGVSYSDFQEGGRFADPNCYHHPLELIPFEHGCHLCIEDKEESTEYLLGYDNIIAGIRIMAEKYPRHFADMMTENDDASTGDVFLQCCLFGEVIYG